jgi:molybdenum cofactor synthesis domain-containing protein
MAAMIPLLEAQRIVASLPLPAPDVEHVPLEAALGRVLAEAPASDLDLPPFDRVTMDGFAVRSADTGAPLRIVGSLAAGPATARALLAGEALRIMTGAPLPAGADAVVPIEESLVAGDRVSFARLPKSGQNVHRRAVDLPRGARPLPAGERVTTGRVALLATLGRRRVAVGRMPLVAVLTSGDELVEPDVLPTGGQIRDSNRFALAAQVASAAAAPTLHPIVRDDPAALRAAVEEALRGADVVLLTGGSSVGDFDYSGKVLAELGGRVRFEQVAIKPGKPVLLFTLGDAIVFCLPGNPVSSFVTFEVLVRPLLERMAGAIACWPLAEPRALASPLAAPAERDLLQLARLEPAADGAARAGWRIEPLRWSGSGDLVALARASALVNVPKGARLDAGAIANTFLLRSSWDDLPRASEPGGTAA